MIYAGSDEEHLGNNYCLCNQNFNILPVEAVVIWDVLKKLNLVSLQSAQFPLNLKMKI